MGSANLFPTAQQSRVSSTLYSTSNVLVGSASGDFDIRDTSTHKYILPLGKDGVVDMGLHLAHSLTYVLGTGLAAAAAGDTITKSAHGLANDQRLTLSATTAGGLSTSATYFVVGATTNTFQLALAVGGSPVDITADGTATVVVSVTCRFTLSATYDTSEVGGSSSATGVTLLTSVFGVDEMPNGARYMFVPEASLNAVNTSTLRIYAVPELRGPLQGVILQVTARSIPDAGTVTMRVIRRY